jgi:hypothetical protein
MQERTPGVTYCFIELLTVHLDITTEGHEGKPVFGATPLFAPQGWTETNGKALNPDPGFFRNYEMTKFMYDNKRTEHNCKMHYRVEKICNS